ncbi:MAG: T9SS type A sorting domain-containing protein [Lentimicrobiaceae bacterium]|nr:T9SS type A sorting domain-containing protein [Lentimicrobiaceae bacterium]
MEKGKRLKVLALAICLGSCSLGWAAEEKISFRWQVGAADIIKNFRISAISNVEFTIDWGDGEVETRVGKGSWETISHRYYNYKDYNVNISTTSPHIFTHFDCNNRRVTSLIFINCGFLEELHCFENQLVYLNLKECESIMRLYCFNNQLTELHLPEWKFPKICLLTRVYCYSNRLPLSKLYEISEWLNEPSGKRFGTQTLATLTIAEGGMVDFSPQAEFGGIPTVFKVDRNGSPASQNDYAINNGIITFTNTGTYKITMTNAAIVLSPNQSTEVVAEFVVGNVGIVETLHASSLRVYPNPTDGKLIIEIAGQARNDAEIVEIYDVVGQVVGAYRIRPKNTEPVIDISHLASGLYFLKIGNKVIKVVKE